MKFLNKLRNVIIYTLILSFITSPVLAGYYVQPIQPKYRWDLNSSSGLSASVGDGGAFAQTYAGTNRNRINALGVQETVAANTPVIDHVGTALTPTLRLEPAAANILLEVITDWTKTTATVTKDATSWLGAANGAWTIVASGNNATVISTAVAGSSAAFTFVCAIKRSVGTGAVYMTVDNGATWTEKTLTSSFQYFSVTKTAATPQLGFKLATSGDEIIVDCLMLVSNTALASSYFAPAAAIGAELVTDGGFAAVTEAQAAAGVTVVRKCYKILERTDIDYTADGAPNNNVGTYFNSTVGGATIDGAGGNDRLNNVTFTNWSVDIGAAPQATAGVLTGRLKILGSTTSAVYQSCLTIGKVVRIQYTCQEYTGGQINIYAGSTTQTGFYAPVAGTTYTHYLIVSGSTNFFIYYNSVANFVIDDVSIKEHGTVRASEANTVTLAVPAAVSTALAATGTLVVDWMPAYARAAGVVTGIVSMDGNTASALYTTTAAGNLSGWDGTTVAASTAAYTANVLHRLVLQWPSSANKYKVGASIAMAGIAYGAESNFDGSITAGANIVLGPVLHGTIWIKSIRFYDELLSTTYIDNNL